ncbi:16S rRNA (guanine(527)-N(7))-methyltransferase RsmG [Magnetovibrio sp.]|uniref:16S rRNA (guanine(527)-N(7))-methyltransferase RsmG n=1 Tax=Magnetovibrio sp. TaxID=2024836 RepID=UPI002F955AA1
MNEVGNPAVRSAAEFQAAIGASDDALARLKIYAELLVKWQAKINLVGPDTLPDLWQRHMLDSAQIAVLVPQGKKVVDFGSGAGFPGLVLACLDPTLDVHLVESDQRKCAFLREVNRAAGCGATVHNDRIENLAPLNADVVTSRALASLDKLLAFAEMHSLSTGIYLFLKGKRWSEELTEAEKTWKMRVIHHPSRTDPAGMILEMKECIRRHEHLE